MGEARAFGVQTHKAPPWRVLLPSCPQTLQREQLTWQLTVNITLGVHPRFPPLHSAWEGHPFTQISFQLFRLGAVAPARQRVLGNAAMPWEQSGWANLHGGLEKGFLLVFYQVPQSTGTPF